MEFNKDKVAKITSEILTSLERLEELKRLSKDAFLSDPHKIGSAKYNFIVAIEGAVDLCNHVIAKMAIELRRTMPIPLRLWLREAPLTQNLQTY